MRWSIFARFSCHLSLLLASFCVTGCAPETESSSSLATPARYSATQEGRFSASPAGTLAAYFFDVDQGDATLLAGPDFTILVDAGRHDRADVVPYLRAAGVEKIDLLIGTHPHADHIGQIPQVMAAFAVSEVWMSGDSHNSRTFENALDAILDSDARYHEPRAGEVVQVGSARVEVLNPTTVNGDFHAGCIAVRVVFGEVAFLLTGDVETPNEWRMIQTGYPLQAQILKLGHHGSSTSSSSEFLGAVRPEVAIYSAGVDNSYGHPHAEVIQRVLDLGIRVYGTPQHGSIRVLTDGRRYEIETGHGGTNFVAGERADGININTASKDELVRIAHVGPERAEQLIRKRPFRTLDELKQLDGISDGRLREIKAQGLARVE